eukprot:2251653-Amphidinium_carterae.1
MITIAQMVVLVIYNAESLIGKAYGPHKDDFNIGLGNAQAATAMADQSTTQGSNEPQFSTDLNIRR